MLKPNTFFQLKLLVFHIFFSERPGEIPYLYRYAKKKTMGLDLFIKFEFARAWNISVIHLVNNRVYIHVHAVIYSVTFNYFTYVCRNKSPTGLML